VKAQQKHQEKDDKPNRSQPLTKEEINKQYTASLLRNSSPEAMLNTVWLKNTIHFGQKPKCLL
jgi:hypothetical protein